jgi:hypothetical protein
MRLLKTSSSEPRQRLSSETGASRSSLTLNVKVNKNEFSKAEKSD